MIKYAVVIAAVAGICSAMPAGAEEVGVGVGPVGVTVGSGHDERDRDRDKAVIIKKDRDHDRDGAASADAASADAASRTQNLQWHQLRRAGHLNEAGRFGWAEIQAIRAFERRP